MTQLTALWAVWSKQPRDTADYRVLACSDDHRPTFEQMMKTDPPGTPTTTETGRADSLPWVIIDPAGPGRTSVTVMSWTADKDADRRPITRTDLFIAEYPAAAGPVGFAALYSAAAEVALPVDTPQVELDVAEAAPQAADPAGVGLGWAAGVAALLLEGRVVVTGADRLDEVERLAAVDAVAAMLPAGYRSTLTTATWASKPDQRPQRLCFGPYAGEYAVEVRLGADVPSPRAPAAIRYLRELGLWLDRGEVQRLQDHLAVAGGHATFDSGPALALEIVQQLELPRVLVEEIREGNGRPGPVLDMLARQGPAVFGDDLLLVYRFLLTAPDIDPVAALSPFWSPLLRDTVTWAARTGRPPLPGAELAEAFVPTARQTGDLDEFLVRLLITDTGQEPAPELRQVALRVLEGHQHLPTLQKALLSDRSAGTGLVGECQFWQPQLVPRVVKWLAGLRHRQALPDWLALLHHVVTATGQQVPPAEPLVRAAVQEYLGVAVVAFAQVTSRGNLNLLGPALWANVVETAAQPPEDTVRSVLVPYLAGGAEVAGDARSRAWADIALVAAGQTAQAVTPEAAQVAAYVGELDNALGALPVAVSTTVAPLLPGAVLDAVLGRDRHRAATETAAIVLAEALRRPARWSSDAIGRLIVGRLMAADGPELLTHLNRHGGSPWNKLVEANPELRRTLPRLMLRQAALEDAPPERLAEAWATLVAIERLPRGRDRTDLEEIVRWPRRSAPQATPVLLEQTVELLRQRSDVGAEALAKWHTATVRSIVRRRSLGLHAAEITVAALRGGAEETADLRRSRIGELERHEAELRQTIKEMKRERKAVRATAKAERRQLIALLGAANAGEPWWSWRRWWPSR